MQDILNEKFSDFNDAEKAVMHYCNTHFHPIRVDYKEKFESYNKKVKQESQIKNQPLDSIYACRWTCKHFGHQKPYLIKKNQGKRNNQAILPCGCKMFIYVSYDNQRQCYGVKKLFLEHNHPYGIEEFSMYSSQRQPKGLLEQQTLMLIEHGANTALVTDSLNRSGLKTKPRDIYNIKQKLKFKGSALDEIKTVLDFPGSLYHIDANSDGQVECITWTTTEQIMLLQKFPDVIMMDGTYKVNNLSMPLYTLAVVDQHGMGRPVIQSIVYREDQAHLRMFLIRSHEWAGFNTFSTSIFVIDKAKAEISVLQAVFPDNHILLCRFHVSKAFVHKIKKSNLISNDKESLYKATKRLLYGNQQTCDEALLHIQETFPEFYTYLTNNWLMMADMFMGYKRKGLLHIDNHTNNRLERYHRTLKDVGLTSRMSPGNLISKIIKINRVQLEKSKHADFDQRLKINTKLPECLKFYAHAISSFILQHMVEQYNLSQKEGYSLQEENNCLQVKYNGCLFPLQNWTCQCDNAAGYGVPCSHAFFAIREKNMNLSDLDLIHKRWFVPTHQMANVNQGDNLSNSCMTFSIQPVALCNSTVNERYNTALSHLQPLASILSEFTPSKFDLAIKWLESVYQQCISGEWELQVQQHHSEDDVISENLFQTNVEIFPESSSATLECVLPVSPKVYKQSLQTNSVTTSNISPTITCETLHVERLQTNVEIFPESSLSATLECVLPVSSQISIQKNSETTSKTFPTITFPTITCEALPIEKRYTTRILEDIDIVLRKPQRFPPGRPAVKKQRLFYNVTKPLEKLGVYEKDFIRLTWFVKDSIAQNSLQSGSKISSNDLSLTVPYIVNDKRANLHELKQYFDESAWAEIEVRCKSTSSDSWPCYHCQQIQSASKLQKWIQCDHCLYWYHYYCVGILRKPKSHWFCMDCKT